LRRALADEPNIVFHFCSEPGAAIMTAQRIAPTVILQDLVMPGIEGLTWVREISRPRSDASYANYCALDPRGPHHEERRVAVGANDYIVKLPTRSTGCAYRYHSQAYLSDVNAMKRTQALHESQRQLMASNHRTAKNLEHGWANRAQQPPPFE